MKRSDIPSLDDLRAFETAARLGSLRSAGDSLALSHGAVSRRITKLSRDLGFKLFEKDGRGQRLTPAGETLSLTLGRVFAELATTVESLRTAEGSQAAIVLSCEPSVAMRWLIPRLARLHEAYPDIVLHLSVGGGPVDFRRDRIDLAFRRLDFALPDSWHVERLFYETVGPVMSPQLIEAFREGRYTGLATRTRPNAWSDWLSAHPAVQRPSQLLYYDHHFIMLEAAAAGLGVGLSPFILATDDIRRDRLAAPAGFDPDSSSYGLIRPSGRELTGGARILLDWLRDAFTTSFG